MLTLQPIAATEESGEGRARIPPELLGLAAAKVPWTSYLALDGRGDAVGVCAFKGAPNRQREVEIAYLTFPEHEGLGHGTAMARVLRQIAGGSGEVDYVIAQTLPEENASVRICRRLHFRFEGEVIDPEDGKVWRWRKSVHHPAAAAGSLSAALSPALRRASGGPDWA